MKQGCKVILMLFWGILLGILLTVGGIAIGGYWAYQNLTLNKVQNMIGTDIVDLGEYNNKPVKDLIIELSNIANMSVQEIDNKFLDNAIKNNLVLQVNGKSVDLTQNIFKNLFNSKISQVTDEIGKIKENITFGFIYEDILLASDVQIPNDSLLLQKFRNKSIETSLSEIGNEKLYTFWNEGHTFENKTLNTVYTAIQNLSINELSDSAKFDNAINSMKVNDLLNLDNTATGVLGALQSENLTLGELKETNTYDNLLINDILEIDNSSTGVLGAIASKNWKLVDLKNSENFGTLNLGKILNVQDTATGFLKAIKEWQLNDITNENINNLTIGAILNVSDEQTGILGAIRTWKLNELNNTKFLEITVGTALETNATTGIMSRIKDWKLNELTDTKFNDLISNLTIGELVDEGILAIDGYDAKKDTMIGTKTLKETTLKEFINYAVSVL